MSDQKSLIADLLATLKKLPPPKFDRVAVHDDRALASIPRRDPASSAEILPLALTGIPVITDPSLEVGVIELRLGDEVYKRVYLPELRA